jgi:deoxyribonuclease-4
MILGAHESIAGGAFKAFERAEADGAQSLQIFTKNARGWAAKPLTGEEISNFHSESKRTGFPAIAHCSYLVNLGSEDPVMREKSLAGFTDELERCHALGVPYLVVHPGAHADEKTGVALIARALDECFGRAKGAKTEVLLENTAGQGSSVGHRFEQLAAIIAASKHGKRLGVCLDTCHLYAAGYDIAHPKGYRETLAALEGTVGLARIKAFHLNDCKKPLGCRVDRHEEIGKGTLGLEAFERFVREPAFAEAVAVLETPEIANYKHHLTKLRSLAGQSAPKKAARR